MCVYQDRWFFSRQWFYRNWINSHHFLVPSLALSYLGAYLSGATIACLAPILLITHAHQHKQEGHVHFQEILHSSRTRDSGRVKRDVACESRIICSQEELESICWVGKVTSESDESRSGHIGCLKVEGRKQHVKWTWEVCGCGGTTEDGALSQLLGTQYIVQEWFIYMHALSLHHHLCPLTVWIRACTWWCSRRL